MTAARRASDTGAVADPDLVGGPHLPGRTPRPPEAAFAPLKAALEGADDPAALAASAAFGAALRLFERRYYWEAHEMFEAVWIRLPPASAERVLLRGLIQLSNAGLKARMGRGRATARILALADADLAEVAARAPAGAMGLTPGALAALRCQAAGEADDE
ncbi:DUF309 domain-containing protein [Roseovarius amoyensis]|uniref:DUF309 domain-containing protein n=1 Tax=Roseovarius amoyensis TaxID=2211448 RepID=UPI000DBE3C99|nr:DUF309 domain-containing protein [Roseovarius amoyensis]